MRAPARLLATSLLALAMAGCQGDPVSQSGTPVRLAPRLVATEPVPPAQRIRIALLVGGTLRDTLDLPYASGQELSLGTVPSGASFEVALVGYDTLNGGVARWGALSRGIASETRTQVVEIVLEVPARPVVTFSGASTLDSLTSPDSVWAAELADAWHPGRATEKQRSRLGKGDLAPNVGAIVFAQTDTATFIPAALARAWSGFRVVWSDTVLLEFSAPTAQAKMDSIIDARDGRTYRTTTWLGTTWMAENLAWAGLDGTLGLCYENDTASCARFGRLYTWSQAMDGSTSSTSSPSTARGICPAGWHLPSPTEWDSLGRSLGGGGSAADSLRDGAAWQGRATARDAIGFAALPAGQGYAIDTTFTGKGTDAWWWTSEKLSSSDAVRYGMTGSDNKLFTSSGSIRGLSEQMFAVRCVKNPL